MKGDTVHVTNEQLQMTLDGRLSEAERGEILRHVQQCAVCTAAYRGLRQLDEGLRELPVTATSAGFTRKLMGEILPSGHLSLAFRIVENLAYLFAALFVLGIIAVVFIATGVVDTAQVSQSEGVVSSYVTATGDWLGQTMQTGTAWLQRYLPGQGGSNIILFGIAVLGGLALLDRLLHRRFAQRTR